jgi:hypothetical protein
VWIRSASRVGSGGSSDSDGAKIAAGSVEHVTDSATAVSTRSSLVRPGHEPPHRIERQVAAVLGQLVDGQLPLQLELLDEGAPLRPGDQRPGLPQRGEPLAPRSRRRRLQR